MKERSIVFNSDMVQAILDGRKTQTRRPLRTQPPMGFDFCDIRDNLGYPASLGYAWAGFGRHNCCDPLYYKCPFGCQGDRLRMKKAWRNRSNRIAIEIADIRVEQIQDISEVDAKAEGVLNNELDGISYSNAFKDLWNAIYCERGLGWNRNPWVWVICFKTVN